MVSYIKTMYGPAVCDTSILFKSITPLFHKATHESLDSPFKESGEVPHLIRENIFLIFTDAIDERLF